MQYHRPLIAAAGILAALVQTVSAATVTEDFSTDPFTRWSFGIGNNSNNQFIWNTNSPAAYTGDAVGSLGVHFDSSLPSTRLQLPLGFTLTDTNNFSVSTRFSFNITSAPADNYLQIAFGLVNSTLTGGDRTGSLSTTADTFHTVEFNYFPQTSSWSGRTLTPAVMGAQKGGADAFGNFAALFGPASDLGDNTTGITELPANVTLQATLDYAALTKILTLTMHQINPDGSLTLLNTELTPLNLVAAGYDTNFSFQVDSLGIMAYYDAWANPSPSLVADMTVEQMQVAAVPEPSSALLVALGTGALIVALRRRRFARH